TYNQIAAIFGLGESEGNVKANASGISLVVSDEKKNTIINANRPTYIKFEKDVIDNIFLAAALDGKTDLLFL
ncbi:hypothetical protein IH799_10235, partial [candidate division KSB1 bacterium]|nr:hypothetical protein [candidate division KSB1 bacterium]